MATVDGSLKNEGNGSFAQLDLSNGTNKNSVKVTPSLTGNITFPLPASAGTTGQVLTTGSGTTSSWQTPGGGGTNTDIWFIYDERTSGTAPDAYSTTGVWQTRTINTLSKPSGTGTEVQLAVSPASTNQLRIDTGSYFVHIYCSGFSLDAHMARLQNITDATTEILGSVHDTNSQVTPSLLHDVLTVTSGPKVYEIQHRGASTGDFGVTTSFSVNEIYLTGYIQKI